MVARKNDHAVKTTDAAAPYLEGMNEGWKQSLDCLEAFVTKA